VIFGVIVAGSFYVNPGNWSPFAPEGISGVFKGVSAVFFAFIGFDAISTTAEECRNPERDLPRSIFYSLIICTVLYVIISLVLTGMVNYRELAVGDPLAFVFKKAGLNRLSGIIAFSALIAMAGVLLIFQIGQPRIWMSMSRDGLLPAKFSKIHPKYKTPSFATIVTGFVVAIPALFMNLTEVTDLTSIGTLFAFVVVCAGILIINHKNPYNKARFKVPYINGKYVVPGLTIVVITTALISGHDYWLNTGYLSDVDKIPAMIFALIMICLAFLTFRYNLSLIPVLGLLSCLFLMSKLGYTNWIRFIVWLAIGIVIYFTYSYKNSVLNRK